MVSPHLKGFFGILPSAEFFLTSSSATTQPICPLTLDLQRIAYLTKAFSTSMTAWVTLSRYSKMEEALADMSMTLSADLLVKITYRGMAACKRPGCKRTVQRNQ